MLLAETLIQGSVYPLVIDSILTVLCSYYDKYNQKVIESVPLWGIAESPWHRDTSLNQSAVIEATMRSPMLQTSGWTG